MSPDPAQVGGYISEKSLGAGRLGEAWLSRRADRPGSFVVRRLPSFLVEDRAATERFLEELRPLGQLDHPNLARLVEAGPVGGAFLVVTEHVEGLSLAQCLGANAGPLPAPVAAELLAQACEGLAYVHGKPGLAHGELCLENLRVDLTGLVQVVDVGLAKAISALTSRRVDPAQPAMRFLAPEHLRDGSASARSDVYSLGAVLFALVTGRLPLEAVDDPLEFAYQLCQSGLPTPDELFAAASVPEELREVVRQATALSPAARFASANELVTWLDAYLKTAAPIRQQEIGELVRFWAGRGEDPRLRAPSVIVSPALL